MASCHFADKPLERCLMELPSVTPLSVVKATAAEIRNEHAILMAQKTINVVEAQGQALVQLVEMAAQVGQSVNTSV